MEDTKHPNSNSAAIRDLNVASFLMASGEVQLEGVERTQDNTVYFHFTPKDKAEKLVSDYWSDTTTPLQPRKLFGSQRDLKDILFSGGQRG